MPTHYWNICVYSVSVFYDNFVTYQLFNFSGNLLNSKPTEIYCIITYRAFQWFSFDLYPQDLLHMPYSLFYVNQFFNKHHQIWITFDNIFVFQNLMKYDVELKILYCSTCSFNNCNCAFTLNIFSNKFPNKLSC